MANKNLFQTIVGKLIKRPDAINEAGAPAYSLTSEQALAQLAVTGCLNGTFYATAQDQLKAVLELANECEPEFVAKVAVYARRQGCMKDMPALLCAVLAVRDGELLQKVFGRVIDNGKMLRNFVQIVRSGAVGRKSLGTMPRRLVRQWIAERSMEQLLHASLGQKPSLRDVIRMVHPKPNNAQRANFYAYLIGKPFDREQLPDEARQLEMFKIDEASLPDINFQFLSALPLTTAEWRVIAQRASWTTLRMNLNTFRRHGVFDCDETTLLNIKHDAPSVLRAALEQAMEIATANVPALPGRTVVAVDISGSMHAPVTGYRLGSTSTTTCLDAAAVLAATVLRRNPDAVVMPFHTKVSRVKLDAKESIVSTASRLRELPSGGTDCSVVLRELNRKRERADTVIFFSDNESWIDANRHGGCTGMLKEWRRFKVRNPGAQLVCIDIQPYTTVQAPVAEDVTHVGGFSDQVFEVLRSITAGDRSPDVFVDRIRMVAI